MPATNLVRLRELEYLNFTMPNGGEITLKKHLQSGSSMTNQSLYYTKNGISLNSWAFVSANNQYSPITLQPGEKIWIRNNSTTSTYFSTGANNYFNFKFTDVVYASGNVMSLKCKYPNVASGGAYSFCKLFLNCTTLITPPEILTSSASQGFLYSMFEGCTNLEYAPELFMTSLNSNGLCFYHAFYGCSKINMLKVHATSFPTSNTTTGWLYGTASTGDLWCPNTLNLTNNSTSGIPTGWTRHDL